MAAFLSGLPSVSSETADFVTVTAGPLGVVVAVLGLGYAILQIRKTRTAAEAALEGSHHATQALVQNHLLFLIPDLTRLAAQAEAATVDDQRGDAAIALTQWRTSASRMRGLLRARGDLPADVAAAFSGAFSAITEAKTQLRNPQIPVADAMAAALTAIDTVMDEISDLGGQLLAQPQAAD